MAIPNMRAEDVLANLIRLEVVTDDADSPNLQVSHCAIILPCTYNPIVAEPEQKRWSRATSRLTGDFGDCKRSLIALGRHCRHFWRVCVSARRLPARIAESILTCDQECEVHVREGSGEEVWLESVRFCCAA